MKHVLYRPNPKNSGCLVEFAWQPSETHGKLNFYLGITEQTGWDNKRKVGSFKGGDRLNVKFSSPEELGSFYDALKNRKPFRAYHSTQDYNTQISMIPCSRVLEPIKSKSGNTPVVNEYFGVSVRRGDISQPFTISAGDVTLLLFLIEACLVDNMNLDQFQQNATQKTNAKTQSKKSNPFEDDSEEGLDDNEYNEEEEEEENEDDEEIPF